MNNNPSPCDNCTKPCKGDMCPSWRMWFSARWKKLRIEFRKEAPDEKEPQVPMRDLRPQNNRV